MSAARALSMLGLLVLPAAAGAEGEGKLYAVVVGISEYPGLPAELALPSARGEASRLALMLREEAGYTDVRLLTDSGATREGITSALRDDLGGRVGPQDTLLFYFVGHGVGRDFDDPFLLTHDSRQDELPGSAWSVSELAATLRGAVPAGHFIVVTDAAHAGSVEGLRLLGPSADSWPALGPSSHVLSATQPRMPDAGGAFARHFMDAVGGGADFDDSGAVTTAELGRYLALTVPDSSGNQQYTSAAGRADRPLEVSRGVLFKNTLPPHLDPTRPPPGPVGGPPPELDFTVDKAKFVFRDAFEPVVQCRDQDPMPCENQCYVWDVAAGPCEVSAYVGGQRVSGKAFVVARGAYVCEPAAGTLNCSRPR